MDLMKLAKQQWDRVAAAACGLVGAICILLGWLGVARSTLPTEQIPYLASGAVFGLFLLGVGTTLWLSADLRDEWRKLEEIHQALTDPDVRDAPASAPSVEVERVAEEPVDEPAEGAILRNGTRRREPIKASAR